MLFLFNPIDIKHNIIFQSKLAIRLRQIPKSIMLQQRIIQLFPANIQTKNPAAKLIKRIKNRNPLNNSEFNPL